MKATFTLLVALIVLGPARAHADEPVTLTVRVEPVTDAAELEETMRQNTVRIALQRYRLWQQTVAREQRRDAPTMDDDGRHKPVKPARRRASPPPAAPDGDAPSATAPTPAPTRESTTARERAQLRDILREQRGSDDLAAKLRDRAREREQERRRGQSEEQRQQQRNQRGDPRGPGPGGR